MHGPQLLPSRYYGLVAAVVLCAAAAVAATFDHRWLVVTGSNHSALEDPFEGPRVDPFSIMVNAKNLPSQESFNFEDERCLATPIQSMERCHLSSKVEADC